MIPFGVAIYTSVIDRYTMYRNFKENWNADVGKIMSFCPRKSFSGNVFKSRYAAL